MTLRAAFRRTLKCPKNPTWTHINETRRLNADGEGTNVRKSSLKLHPVGHCREVQDTGARREEVASIVVSVEAYEIAVQNAEKDLSAHWQDPIRGTFVSTQRREYSYEIITCRSHYSGRGYGGRTRS